MKITVTAILLTSAIILSLALLNTLIKATELDKKEFNSPDNMAMCLESGREIRCIGEKTEYSESEVVFYRCEDGYTKVLSPFTHICESRRRDHLLKQQKLLSNEG